jgi:hypothetical protein
VTRNTDPGIAHTDLPGLFQASDAASSRAQRRYLYLVALDLGVMIAGAALGAVSVTSSDLKQELALASAVSIAIGFALTFALEAQHLSATWYDGRAVAESAKTTAWRYMMCADPYLRELAEPDVDRTFTSALDSFLRERKSLAGSLSTELFALPEITDAMRRIRASSCADRKALYVESRLADQRLWYAQRAEHNAERARFLFVLVLVSQALALIAAIAVVRWPDTAINLAGVFAAVAAALIAWTQLKKYEELATMYGLTAQELRSVEDRARHVTDEEQFTRFVLTAESAISREHALWLTRREPQ